MVRSHFVNLRHCLFSPNPDSGPSDGHRDLLTIDAMHAAHFESRAYLVLNRCQNVTDMLSMLVLSFSW